MRSALLLFLLATFASAGAQTPQTPQAPAPEVLTSGIDTSLRAVAADHFTLWASGSNGVVLRSADSGKSWTRLHIDNADTADFRGIQAFGTSIAYVMSVGNDNKSHIYKTTDAGKTWRMQYSDPRPAFFLDGLVCWTETHCFAISDPIDNKFVLLETRDGRRWTEIPRDSMPAALPNEGIFAASNSAMTLCNENELFFGTGGPAARVFHSKNAGRTWTVTAVPILGGNASAGIFSIGCSNDTIVAVGGDYRKPGNTQAVAAYSGDWGTTWSLSDRQPSGFRSGVTFLPEGKWIAVGTNGFDISLDNGVNWKPAGQPDLNAILTVDEETALAVGAKGTFIRLRP
jgi:photosystem II stability/assembly factor-like uncharacterized protein